MQSSSIRINSEERTVYNPPETIIQCPKQTPVPPKSTPVMTRPARTFMPPVEPAPLLPGQVPDDSLLLPRRIERRGRPFSSVFSDCAVMLFKAKAQRSKVAIAPNRPMFIPTERNVNAEQVQINITPPTAREGFEN